MFWGRLRVLKWATQSAQKISGFNPQNLANSIWALGKLDENRQLPNDFPQSFQSFLREWASQSAGKIDQFNPQALANSIWACGLLQQGISTPLEEVVRRLKGVIPLSVKPYTLFTWAADTRRTAITTSNRCQRVSNWGRPLTKCYPVSSQSHIRIAELLEQELNLTVESEKWFRSVGSHVDLYCAERHLVIEVNGDCHDVQGQGNRILKRTDTWTKKGSNSYFGYKGFMITDAEDGFVTHGHVTPANKAEGLRRTVKSHCDPHPQLYRSAPGEEVSQCLPLAGKGFRSGVL